MANDKQKIAFVDFDGTITRHDSLFMFLRHLASASGKRHWLSFSSFMAIAGYALRLTSAERAKCKLLSNAAKGMTVKSFDATCQSFAEVVEADLRDDVWKMLEEKKAHGFEIVIVSASAYCWIRPWIDCHSSLFDDLIATKTDAVGDPIEKIVLLTPNCNREEKVKRVESWLQGTKGVYNRNDFYIEAFGNGGGDKALMSFADKSYFVG